MQFTLYCKCAEVRSRHFSSFLEDAHSHMVYGNCRNGCIHGSEISVLTLVYQWLEVGSAYLIYNEKLPPSIMVISLFFAN
jgi:hypothetical protein